MEGKILGRRLLNQRRIHKALRRMFQGGTGRQQHRAEERLSRYMAARRRLKALVGPVGAR